MKSLHPLFYRPALLEAGRSGDVGICLSSQNMAQLLHSLGLNLCMNLEGDEIVSQLIGCLVVEVG